uniref:Uncharacterized protein n=1 Tax=Physcomitrium patens TaxID=3218 RepID=A0A2K1J737_PHYPA|nr:hypothetical protein PHYPA_020436 [Physcomitrium patens]
MKACPLGDEPAYCKSQPLHDPPPMSISQIDVLAGWLVHFLIPSPYLHIHHVELY